MQSAPFPFHPFLAPPFLITLPGPLFGLIPGRGSRKKERLESWSDRRAIVAVPIGRGTTVGGGGFNPGG